MKNLRNQKGITLVALVVTIIVLLILAGVSLSLVAGSNGIMNRASNAVTRNDVATAKEQAELEIMTALTEYYDEYYARNKKDTTVAGIMKTKFDGTSATSKLSCGGTLVAADASDTTTNYVDFTLTIKSSTGDITRTCSLGKDVKLTKWSPED